MADIGKNKIISIESFVEIVLNKMKVPTLLQLDVVFLAKKYLVDLPTHLHYLKLFEDYDSLSTLTTPSTYNARHISTYLLKSILAYSSATPSPSAFFRGYCTQYPRDSLLTLGEFHKALTDLRLVPEIVQSEAVS